MGLWHINGSPKLGQKTRPYNNQKQKQKKKICKIVDFAVPADHRIKLKKCEKRDKYLDFARELKKLWNMKVTILPIVIGAFGTVTKRLQKGLEDLEVGGQVEAIQTIACKKTITIIIIIIGQNTKKSPGELRRLAVTQTPVKNPQLAPVWRTLKWEKNNNIILLLFTPWELFLYQR